MLPLIVASVVYTQNRLDDLDYNTSCFNIQEEEDNEEEVKVDRAAPPHPFIDLREEQRLNALFSSLLNAALEPMLKVQVPPPRQS